MGVENNDKPWFFAREKILLPLIEARNKAELAYKLDNNQPNLDARRLSRNQLKKAINEAKEAWILKKIKRVNNMNCDPYNAWQCIKDILAGLTGHHKNLNNDLLKMSIKEIASYFSKNVFSRESPFIREAVDELIQKPIKESLDAPLTVKEVRECLNKAQSRKAPGSNGIRIEQYKLLNDENLSYVIAAMQAYRDDPQFDSKDWHHVALVVTLLPPKKRFKALSPKELQTYITHRCAL